MSIFLTDVDIQNTKELLGKIMIHINHDERVQFLCAPGTGNAVVQRCRVMLSRVRKTLIEKGKPRKHFKLHHEVYSYSLAGKRYDAVVVYRSRGIKQAAIESLEAMASHGNLG